MKDAAPVASKKRAAEESEAPAKKAKTAEVAPSAVAAPDAAETSTIFVGGLSWNVDNEWLKSEFEEVGEVVSARVVTDRETQKSRGFGYVEFTTPASATKALELAGKEIDGRAVKVDLSLPRAPKEGGAFGDRPKKVFNDTLSGPPTTTLFVGNLPFSATEDAVWSAFADFGDVSSVRCPCLFAHSRLLRFTDSLASPTGPPAHRHRDWPPQGLRLRRVLVARRRRGCRCQGRTHRDRRWSQHRGPHRPSRLLAAASGTHRWRWSVPFPVPAFARAVLLTRLFFPIRPWRTWRRTRWRPWRTWPWIVRWRTWW